MFCKNKVNREIPDKIDGRELKPFSGAFSVSPQGKKFASKLSVSKPADDKLCKNLREALERAHVRDGATISFHHHLREGDAVVNMVIDEIARMGIKNVTVFPTALFAVHEKLIEHIKSGVISKIEGSLNGPIGRFVSAGNMKSVCVLRSHGGRVRAVESGDIKIDIAVIASPTADEYGNCSGLTGKSACGPLAYADIDSRYADNVIVITDNLVKYPLVPHSIPSTRVDSVVNVESIGDPSLIVTGTMRITKSPTRLLIAKYSVDFLDIIGYIKNDLTFQTGAGGISLAVTKFMADRMREKQVKAKFINGGITKFAVDMLKEGLTDSLIDVQSFDLEAIKSMSEDKRHFECSVDEYANYFSKGCLVNKLDVGFLGATEVDIDFNVNVNTHTDGLLLHGIGGHQDVAAGCDITMITIPAFRNRLPIILDSVTTVTTPGETVDVVVTEMGIAINPLRKDIIEKAKSIRSIPIMEINEMKDKIEKITGKPDRPKRKERTVALIEYRDGTIIDTVREV
ncbi:MAG: citrate lyase subunit alpha [bacterium]